MRRLALRLLLAAALVLAALATWLWVGLPARSEVRALATKSPERTRLMDQRAEEAKKKGRKARVAQSWVPLSRVSRHLIHAVLSSEDQNFFGHGGVDWKAIEESIEKNVEKGTFARGGSTITQQLAKNLYFGTQQDARPQGSRARGDALDGGGPLEGPHPRAVPQPDRVGRRRLRVRGGRATLVRQARLGPVADRGRRARRHDPEPAPPQPAGERSPPRAGHAPRAVAHGPGRLPRARRGRARRRAAARAGGRGRGAARRSRDGGNAGVDPAPRPGGLAGGDPGARPRRGRRRRRPSPEAHRAAPPGCTISG